MAIEVSIKKWGNSFGVILPKELMDKRNLKENQKILIEVVKEADLTDVFGLIKKRKMSAQKMKDLSREQWKN